MTGPVTDIPPAEPPALTAAEPWYWLEIDCPITPVSRGNQEILAADADHV